MSAAGCKMIMSLITSIHTYRPANLFLIITMRSEELHRCSEFIGVTEVVNSAMYLVDLIGGGISNRQSWSRRGACSSRGTLIWAIPKRAVHPAGIEPVAPGVR